MQSLFLLFGVCVMKGVLSLLYLKNDAFFIYYFITCFFIITFCIYLSCFFAEREKKKVNVWAVFLIIREKKWCYYTFIIYIIIFHILVEKITYFFFHIYLIWEKNLLI